MSDSKHTPGPWGACNEGSCRCGQVWSKTADHPVAVVTRGAWGDTWPEWRVGAGEQIEAFEARMDYGSISDDAAKANALLIAAAPDLLAALKAVTEALRIHAPGTPLNNHMFDDLGIKAYAALAKAEPR